MAANVKYENWLSREDIDRATRAALLAATNQLKNACDKMIPLDQGTLKDSGRIIRDESKPIVRLQWSTPYARRQWYGEFKHARGRVNLWGIRAAIKEGTNMTNIAGKVFTDSLEGKK